MRKYFFGILLFSMLFIAACSDGSSAGQAIQSKSVQCNKDATCKASFSDCLASKCNDLVKTTVGYRTCATTCLEDSARSLPVEVKSSSSTDCASTCRTRYPNLGDTYNSCMTSCGLPIPAQSVVSTVQGDTSSSACTKEPTCKAAMDLCTTTKCATLLSGSLELRNCQNDCMLSAKTIVVPTTPVPEVPTTPVSNPVATPLSTPAADDCLSVCKTKAPNGGADYDTCARSCKPAVLTQVVQKIFGDLTGDGKVTKEDTDCYLSMSVGKTDASCKETDVLKADLNCDRKVDVSDSVIVSQIAAKKITVDSNRNSVLDCAEKKKDTAVEMCNDPDSTGIFGYHNKDSFYTKSKISGGKSASETVLEREDYCSDTRNVVEFNCKDSMTYGWNGFICPTGTSCSDGACKINCVDSDSTSPVGAGDQGTLVQSTTKGSSSLDVAAIFPYAKKILGGYEFTDSCVDTATVREGYCSETKTFSVKDVSCPSGTSCKDGACKTIETPYSTPVSNAQIFESKCLQIEKTTPKIGLKEMDSICAKRGLEKAADISQSIKEGMCLGIYKGVPIMANVPDRKLAYATQQGSSLSMSVFWNKFEKCNKRIASLEGKDKWESYSGEFMVPKTVEEAAVCIELVGKQSSDYFDEKCLATP